MTTQELIDKYTDNLIGIDAISIEKQRVIDEVLTKEIKDKLEEIEAEFAPKAQALAQENELLAAQIKAAVIQEGATVSGHTHQAVWSKPRVSWDSKGLAGYSVAHPEVMVFQQVGEPSVSIRLRSRNA